KRPTDTSSPNQLRRTLHTFKGSARMTGAMRLGELTHRMESRLDVGGAPAPATPALLDALDDDLDRIAFVLEALREGKVNVVLPGTEAAHPPTGAAAVPPPPAAAPMEPAPAPEPVAAKPIVVPLPPVAPVVPAAPITAASPIVPAPPVAPPAPTAAPAA